MIEKTPNKRNIEEAIKESLLKNPDASNKIKNIINSLGEDDIKKISEALKNEDIKNLANLFLKKE